MKEPLAIHTAATVAGIPSGACVTYIVECADGTLYTGWTNDLPKRIRAHNDGRGARYTRTRRPVRPVYAEIWSDKQAAMSRECHIKQMSRAEKRRLILGKEITTVHDDTE